MFIHNLKYLLRVLFRNKMLIFWNFLFPILMGTFFFMAFSNLKNSEKFSKIKVAIINNEQFMNNEQLKTEFENASLNDDKLLEILYENKENAQEMLLKKEIIGYLDYKEDKVEIVVMKNGILETILKSLTEDIIHKSKTLTEVNSYINVEPSDIDSTDYLKQEKLQLSNSEYNLKKKINKNMNNTMIEYYSLIAMSCLYGAIISSFAISQMLANTSCHGKKIQMSVLPKYQVVLGSIIASYLIQTINSFFLLIYLKFILKVELGENLLCILAVVLLANLVGVILGIVVGALFRESSIIKSGIIIIFATTCCYLCGMMGINMKYIVDTKAPILNKINPANMITDAFYSLYHYGSIDRFWDNITRLLLFGYFLFIVLFISLRRNKYEYI